MWEAINSFLTTVDNLSLIHIQMCIRDRRNTEKHNDKDNQKQKRDCNSKNQGTFKVNGKCHDHGTKYDKRTSKKKTKSHI